MGHVIVALNASALPFPQVLLLHWMASNGQPLGSFPAPVIVTEAPFALVAFTVCVVVVDGGAGSIDVTEARASTRPDPSKLFGMAS